MGRRRSVAVRAGAVALALYAVLASGLFLREQASHRQATVRNDFWQAVAGQVEPTGVAPTDDLARALRRAIEQERVGSFVAAPNAYRGVEQALGTDVFDEGRIGCSECGPLTGAFAEQVDRVAGGGLAEVLEDAAPADASVTGVPAPLEAVAVAVGAGAAVALADERRTQALRRRRRDRLAARGLADIADELHHEVAQLRDLPEDQRDDVRVAERIALLESMIADIDHAARAETLEAEAAGIDLAVEHHVASSDPAIRRANDALVARRQALGELREGT